MVDAAFCTKLTMQERVASENITENLNHIHTNPQSLGGGVGGNMVITHSIHMYREAGRVKTVTVLNFSNLSTSFL